MSNSPQQTDKPIDNQCIIPIVITTPIANGVIGGISSVITAYFFKPMWEKIIKYYTKNKTNEK
jgi:hypothetical protein